MPAPPLDDNKKHCEYFGIALFGLWWWREAKTLGLVVFFGGFYFGPFPSQSNNTRGSGLILAHWSGSMLLDKDRTINKVTIQIAWTSISQKLVLLDGNDFMNGKSINKIARKPSHFNPSKRRLQCDCPKERVHMNIYVPPGTRPFSLLNKSTGLPSCQFGDGVLTTPVINIFVSSDSSSLRGHRRGMQQSPLLDLYQVSLSVVLEKSLS